MKPGVYKGKGKGFDWVDPVEVGIEVDESTIKSIEVLNLDTTRETKPYIKNVIDLMIPRIIKNQSLKVDSICGATRSSAGVKGAVRDALKKAIESGGGKPEDIMAFEKPVPKKTETIELSYDVVVVGMAGAGMAAAISTAEEMKRVGRKVSVLALETAGKIGTMPAEFFGINPPRYCEKYNNGKPYMENPQELFDYWYNDYNHGECKKEALELLFEESGKTIDWLELDHRCYMHSAMQGFGECKWLCKYRFQLASYWEEGHVYDGLQKNWDRYEGMDFYYRRLTDDYKALGGEYLTETTGYELIYDHEAKRIRGIKARKYDGTEYVINCSVVISCTGGFLGSREMIEKYLGTDYYPSEDKNWWLYGMYQNKGQIIQSAIENGAATYNIAMSPIIHLKAPAGMVTKYPHYSKKPGGTDYWSINDLPCSVGIQEIGIRISTNGRRTHDESSGFAHWVAGPVWYSVCGTDYVRELAEKGFENPGMNAKIAAEQAKANIEKGFIQPDAKYSKSARINCYGGVPMNTPIPEAFDIMEEGIKAGFVFKGNTLEDLAEIIGVPAEALCDEIARYRGFCKDGCDADYGKPTRFLKDIVAEGPFYAVKCKSTPYASMAALDVNKNVNVLDVDGNVMNGLYACGNDSEGVLYASDVPYAQFGGIALSWAFTTGRVAGINCVSYLEQLDFTE